MRVRAMDANGDMTFGGGSANFLVNSPEAVAQVVETALQLQQGEWFLDTTVGVPYQTQVLGRRTAQLRDQAVKAAILGVQGVTGIISYSSFVVGRQLFATATISTAYGEATAQSVPVAITPGVGLRPNQLDFSNPADSGLFAVI